MVTCFTDPWLRVMFRSNHGSHNYNQLAALQILVNDTSNKYRCKSSSLVLLR